MTGPGDLSVVFERSAQHPDDSMEFEFAPHGDSVIIRVDAVVVPASAGCLSGDGATKTNP